MSNIILETKRLILRYQEEKDIDFLTNLWSNPEVTKYIGGPREKDFLAKEFANTAKDPQKETYDLWPVIIKNTNEIIGHCGFIDKKIEGNIEYDLSYIFTPSAWGKGYASEIAESLKEYAFDQLGLDRIVALIKPNNEGSENVAKKIGMTAEKVLDRPGGEKRIFYIINKNS